MPTTIHSFPRRRLTALLAAAALAAATGVGAAPFSTTYTLGEVGASSFPSVNTGQPYSVTLVFDNGGSTAASQTWEASNLTCVIWRMNSAQNVVYAQNLAATPPTTFAGAAHTTVGGVLDGFYTELEASPAAPVAYSASGFVPALQDPVSWHINGLNPVFYDGNYSFDSTLSGVSVSPANWSAPTPFNSPCPAPGPGGTVPQATPVPVLGMGGLTLLAGLLGAVGWRTRRRGA